MKGGFVAWFMYALISAVGAAIVALFVKHKLSHIASVQISVVLFFTMFVALVIYCFFTNKTYLTGIRLLTGSDWLYMVAAGVVAAIAYGAYVIALQRGAAPHVLAIDRLGLLFLVIASILFFDEPLNMWTIAGALLMAGGAFLIVST
jgi:transporter family protein